MRCPASEKLEIIRLVEQSHLPVKTTLAKLGVPKTTFYRWYDRFLSFGGEPKEGHRFSPTTDPRFSYRGENVVQTLERVCRQVGYPKSIRVDQGSEFISRDLDLWAYQKGVVLDFSRPGKPTDNAYIEAFNSRLRQECLNASWFLSMGDARARIEEWRTDYNENHPHSALGGLTPSEFADQLNSARKVA